MKFNCFFRVVAGATASLLLLSGVTGAKAAVVYTDEATFTSQLASGSYLENFSGLTGGAGVAENTAFSGGTPTFSYTAASSSGSGLFAANGTGLPSGNALSTFDQGVNLVLTFTSGNVTAVGGDFLLTDVDGNANTGSFTVGVSDGTTHNVTLLSAGDYQFVGFTVSSGTISSLTFSGTTQWPTMDNIRVGINAIPEAPTWIGAALIGLVVTGRTMKKFLSKGRQS